MSEGCGGYSAVGDRPPPLCDRIEGHPEDDFPLSVSRPLLRPTHGHHLGWFMMTDEMGCSFEGIIQDAI